MSFKCIPEYRKVIVFLSSFKTSEKLFIIFSHKVDNHTSLEVEFSAESKSTQRVMVTVENEYTLSVLTPGKFLIKYVTIFFHIADIWI